MTKAELHTPGVSRHQYRIAFYLETSAIGGTEHSVASLIRGVDAAGHAAFVFCPASGDLRSAIGDWTCAGACVIRDPHVFSFRKHRAKDILGLAKLFGRRRIDLIHIQVQSHGCVAAILAAKLARIPVIVVTQRSVSPETASSLRRWAAPALSSCITAATANSQSTKRLMVERMGWPAGRIQVIHNGIDVARFAPRDAGLARAALGFSSGTPMIVFAGRLDRTKGLDTAIKAIPRILARVPSCVFVIAGQGEEESVLRQLSSDLGVGTAVRFIGFRRDVPELLAAADVCVVPSTSEPFGLVVAEAMAMEKAVVASRVDGIPEVLGDDGRAGTLVPPSDPGSLAQAVIAYLTDPAATREAGRRGRERVLEMFTSERLSHDFNDLYARLLSGRAR